MKLKTASAVSEDSTRIWWVHVDESESKFELISVFSFASLNTLLYSRRTIKEKFRTGYLTYILYFQNAGKWFQISNFTTNNTILWEMELSILLKKKSGLSYFYVIWQHQLYEVHFLLRWINFVRYSMPLLKMMRGNFETKISIYGYQLTIFIVSSLGLLEFRF